jgi:hypothetical protein
MAADVAKFAGEGGLPSMKADAERYMDEIVDPTVADFRANPMSPRHAFLACVTMFHAVDYLAHPETTRVRRDKFCQVSPSFLLVDRIAHAFKHFDSGDDQSPIKPPLQASQVIARPPALSGVMESGLSLCGDTEGGVAVWGVELDILGTLTLAGQFLRAQIENEAADL